MTPVFCKHLRLNDLGLELAARQPNDSEKTGTEESERSRLRNRSRLG